MTSVPAMEVRLMPVNWAPEEHQRRGSRFSWFSDDIFLMKGLIAKLRHHVLLRSGLVEANVYSDLIMVVNDVLIGSDSQQRKSLKEEANAEK